MNNETNPNSAHNNGNNNHNASRHSDSSVHKDWKDDVRESVAEAANEAIADARDLAMEAKEEFTELAHVAKEKFDAMPPAKKMEINHVSSIVIALVIGLIAGLAFGWSRGHRRGLLTQNDHTMSSAEMMEQMTANLDGLSGRDLEQQYIADMIDHHRGAITMSTKLIGGSGVTNDQLRTMAANIISTQSAEIEQMKAMQK